MSVPKKKISKQRKRKRRGHYKAETPTLSRCARCGAEKQPHRVCPSCGTYKGEQVLEIEEI